MQINYHRLARRGELPSDFRDWGLRNKQGVSVAYIAMVFNKLPANFSGGDVLHYGRKISDLVKERNAYITFCAHA